VICDQDPSGCRCHHCSLCTECASESHWCENTFWRKLKLPPLPSFSLDHRLVGLELEVVDNTASRDTLALHHKQIFHALPNMGLVHDGSVNGAYYEGFEIVTPPLPFGSSELTTAVTRITAACQAHGIEVNNTCGFHVHFDARDIVGNPVAITHLLRTIYAVEDILFSMNPPSRWNNRYCHPLWKHYAFEDFDTPMSVENFEQYWYQIGDHRLTLLTKQTIANMKGNKYGHAKYSGINFHSLLHRQTIEFRYHAGTLNAEKILQWTTCLFQLLTYALTSYHDPDVRALYKMESSEKKLDAMIALFQLPKETGAYIHERVNKFNAKFSAYRMNQAKESQVIVSHQKEWQHLRDLRAKEKRTRISSWSDTTRYISMSEVLRATSTS
jgi:hypothetical protein